LNDADSLILLSIPGIGPSYSKRILKYRDMLGGYISFDQLWEVYGMDSIRYNAIREFTVLDPTRIEQIPLNTATFKELISHPYIEKAETYAILQYKDFVDSIKSVYELKSNQIIDHDRFIRMLPYLTIKSAKE
jgi:DNA uptake protein ComE-like DNA-binding protein